MGNSKEILVQGISVRISQKNASDYISLTDIANAKDGKSRAADIIKNWIRSRGTLEFIGTWEQMYNPEFKVVELDHFRINAGLPSFVLSPGSPSIHNSQCKYSDTIVPDVILDGFLGILEKKSG